MIILNERNTVVVVGSGMMGSGIAAMSALAGNKTVLVDVDLERAQAGKARSMDCIALRVENGLNTPEQATAAQALLDVDNQLEHALESAKMVVEAIIENLEIKQKLFKQMDECLPAEVAICSNTSGLRISEISALCHCHPERTVTTHFWLPAHLVPLVEVVLGDKTDPAVGQKVKDELLKWGKAPVLVNRDLPGQLANRIFQAIIRESISIVSTGLASAEDVDTAIACGMAMRFPVWGPLKHLDAIGLELGLSVQDTVLPSIDDAKQADDYIRNLVATGNLGAKTGKGFYDWSQRNIADDMACRDKFIIEAVKVTNALKEGR